MANELRGGYSNPYFDNFNNQGEQDLLEELQIEAISIYGQDMFYVPRQLVAFDALEGEDAQSTYTQAIPIVVYVKSVDGFEGDGVFMGKFGLEIRDQVTFTFSKRIWEEEVGAVVGHERPNEGDLIFFPLNGKLFQIQYVNYKPFFYQSGILPTYDVTCELFAYSNQIVDTGIPDIDKIESDFTGNILNYTILTEDGFSLTAEDDNYLVEESYGSNADVTGDQGDIIQSEEVSNNVLSWDETDPFSETGRY